MSLALARNSVLCADVPLRNYSLTLSLVRSDVSTGNSLSGPQLYSSSIMSVLSTPLLLFAEIN